MWRAHERRALSPKAFAILRYLVEHQGQLVTKASLLEAVWPGTVVGEAVLTVGIAELRKALGNDPHALVVLYMDAPGCQAHFLSWKTGSDCSYTCGLSMRVRSLALRESAG